MTEPPPADLTAGWLEALAGRLPRHAALLRRLRTAAAADARVRTFMVGCSIGRGLGDELSDVDAHMTVADEAWPQAVDAVEAMARAAGEPLELLVHALADVPPELHRHLFVQYADGVQLSLVVQPAAAQTRRGRAPDIAVLHDPDDRLGVVVEPRGSVATAGDVREWGVLAWWALDDVVKYLLRGSAWEALQRLHDARTQLWRLWAVVERAPLPAYGLTAVLDTPAPRLPAGMEATVPQLTVPAIAWSAITCAGLLDDVLSRAVATLDAAEGPVATRLGAHVRARLEALPALREGDEPIRVVAHHPGWAQRFAAERAVLERLLAPWLSGGIHHIGSTAVPGLPAKPVVDVMAGVRSLDDSRPAIAVLVDDGWRYGAYKLDEMHWFCRPSPARRELHLHLVPEGSPLFGHRLAFRDALRADAGLRERYARLKRDLAVRHEHDREAYTEGKRAFIESALAAP